MLDVDIWLQQQCVRYIFFLDKLWFSITFMANILYLKYVIGWNVQVHNDCSRLITTHVTNSNARVN